MKRACAFLMAFALIVPGVLFAGGQTDRVQPGAAPAAATVGTGMAVVYTTMADYTAATGKRITRFSEAPMLKDRVAKGELPPLEQRLPADPMVIAPAEQIGEYGGQLVGYSTTTGLGRVDWGTLLNMFQLDGLFRTAPDGVSLIPNLATGYQYSPDAKELTVFLRQGVRWSDGVPFTADDVIFTYNDIIMNEPVALQTGMSMQKSYYSPTEGDTKLVKIDDYTIKFTFPAPYPVFYLNLGMEAGVEGKILFPKHYFEKYHIKYNPQANDIAKKEGKEHWYQLFPRMADMQTGPHNTTVDYPTLRAYVLKQKETGYLIGERNPYYWKVDSAGNQLPYVDRIMTVQNLEPQVANTKVIAGEFDIAGGSIADLTLLKSNEARGRYRVLLWKNPITATYGFHVNQTYRADEVLGRIFRDVRFRRALSLAIDRNEMNEVLFSGLAVPTQATVAPEETKYFESRYADAYAGYDPAAANRLLDEMGLTGKDRDGFRLRPDGKRLSVMLEYAEGYGAGGRMELTRDYWKAIGIEVVLKPQSSSLIFERYPTNEVQIGGWQIDRGTTQESLLLYPTWFVPCGWPPYQNMWPLWLQWALSGGQQGEEPSPEVKANLLRLQKIKMTLDDVERVRLAKEILESQAQNLWVIGTVGFPPSIIVVRDNLRNFPATGLGSWNAACPETFFFKK